MSTDDSITQVIPQMLCPDEGKVEQLTEANRQLIADYQRILAESPVAAREKAFHTMIIRDERCGFGNFGRYEYLLNTDGSHRYRVTVRTFWSGAGNSGQFDKIYTSEAGSRILLGCTDSGDTPGLNYTRHIVGEVCVN